jgi:hypothetical protein
MKAMAYANEGSWEYGGQSVTELTRGCSASLGLHRGLTFLYYKKLACHEMLHRTSDYAGSYEHCNET